ncbi:hypothetical protein BGW38_000424, partial [Lunasporangiospora selenospora]
TKSDSGRAYSGNSERKVAQTPSPEAPATFQPARRARFSRSLSTSHLACALPASVMPNNHAISTLPGNLSSHSSTSSSSAVSSITRPIRRAKSNYCISSTGRSQLRGGRVTLQPIVSLKSAPSLSDEDTQRLVERQSTLRGNHRASDPWLRFYETLPVGTIPSPQECDQAPHSQKILAKIPLQKCLRKTSILGHFYGPSVDEDFVCQVVNESGDFCSTVFKKSGGSSARKNHIVKAHPELFDALQEFRYYQCRVQEEIELPQEPEDGNRSSALPKRTRFETARDSFMVGNTRNLLAHEQSSLVSRLLKAISVHGAPFSLIDCQEFRDFCKELNPLFKVPSTDVLQQMLDNATRY